MKVNRIFANFYMVSDANKNTIKPLMKGGCVCGGKTNMNIS